MLAAALAFIRGGGWKAVLGGAAVLAVLLYVGWQHMSIARLERDVARQKVTISDLTGDLTVARANTAAAQKVNAENQIELARILQDKSVMESTLSEAQSALAVQRANSQNTLREVRRVIVKTPAQCDLAPSMHVVLDELRSRARSRAADRGQDPARGSQAAGGPAEVPGSHSTPGN